MKLLLSQFGGLDLTHTVGGINIATPVHGQFCTSYLKMTMTKSQHPPTFNVGCQWPNPCTPDFNIQSLPTFWATYILNLSVFCFWDVQDPRCPDSQISGNPGIRTSGYPEIRRSGFPQIRKSGDPDFWESGYPDCRISGYPDFRLIVQKENAKMTLTERNREDSRLVCIRFASKRKMKEHE